MEEQQSDEEFLIGERAFSSEPFDTEWLPHFKDRMHLWRRLLNVYLYYAIYNI